MIKKKRFYCIVILFTILLSSSLEISKLLPIEMSKTDALGSNPVEVTQEQNCEKFGHWDENYGIGYDLEVKKIGSKTILFLATGDEGLLIFDVTKHNKPKFVSQFRNGYSYQTLAIHDDFLFLAGGYNNLTILDINDIYSPKYLSEINCGVYAGKIQLLDNLLFVSDIHHGLVIVNFTNPINPSILTSHIFSTYYGIYDFVVRNSLVYICSLGGIEVLNFSNLEEIEMISAYYSSGCRDFVIDNDFIYLNQGSNGLEILKISDLTSFTLINSYRDRKHVFNDLEVVENHLFLVSREYGLIVLDIINPYNISKIFELNSKGAYYSGYFFKGNYYLAGKYTVKIFNVEDINNPILLNKIDLGGETQNTFVVDDVAYIANGQAGLKIINMKDPTHLIELGEIVDDSVSFNSIHVQDNFLYAVNSLSESIEIFDISDYRNPIKLTKDTSYRDYSDMRSGIKVIGNIVFIFTNQKYHLSNTFSYLKSYDISNKSNPILIDSVLEHDNVCFDIEIYNNHLLVATSSRIQIYTITQSNHLVFKDYILTDESYYFTDMEIKNDILYLADYYNGIVVLNISITFFTEIEYIYYTTDFSLYGKGGYKLKIYDEYIYLIDRNDGLIILNILEDFSFIEVGRFYETNSLLDIEAQSFGANMYDLFVYDNLVFVSSGLEGVKIIHYDDIPFNRAYNLKIILIQSSIWFGIIGSIAAIFIIIRIRKRRLS